ncbi:MAG: lamin tail domain-containing protein [Myxococcales bacterium]|nr:lamin tail domain-containing protein [Myxococcales bacterium]
MRRLALVGGIACAFVVWACAQGGSSADEIFTEAPLDASVMPDEDAGKLPTSSTEDAGKDSGAPKDAGSEAAPVDAGCTGKIVINELKNDGATGSDEYVELYNPTSCNVALNGFKLNYSSSAGSAPSTLMTFTASHSIKAGGYFVAAGSTFTGPKDATWASGGLAAGGGRVGVVDAADKLVDSVAYGTLTGNTTYIEGPMPVQLSHGAPAPASNKTIGRKPDGKDTDNNSVDFALLTAPTPGAANN